MKLISGSSNRPLAEQIAKHMGQSLGEVESSTFGNGERRVWVKESVKGQDVALIQSFSEPADTHIVEFALITDALFRQGARRVFAVIPWYGYSLQDKVFRPGEPIAAKVVASMLSSLSIYRFILMNLHNNAIAGFFKNPSSVLSTDELFEQDLKQYNGQSVLVSSDFGGLKRVGKFAEKLHLPFANIDKRRDLVTGEVVAHAMTGDVKGKIAIIIDDVINSGSTAIEAARIIREQGAKKIVMYSTHGILSKDAPRLLQESEIDEVVIANTIDMETKKFPKLRILDVSVVFAKELQEWAK